MDMKEIAITEIENIKIGQAEDTAAGTGCTVVICEAGAPVGLDVRGGGPASRESELIKPLAKARGIHAVLLAGGSAFGLDASGGVMQYLEERDIGYDVGVTKVPLVCQSDLFDLRIGNVNVRPDKAMGYRACVNAQNGGNYQDGCHGAGTGATVGKLGGMLRAMKSGIGSYAVQIGALKVGAIVAVNAIGDVYNWKTCKKVAGVRTGRGDAFADGAEILYQRTAPEENDFTANTTLGLIITNAAFDKVDLTKIAGMAQNGMARAIRPVHTSADGDSVYAMSAGSVVADMDAVGTLAADVLAEAILRAVMSAESAYGLPCARDMANQ